MTTFSGILYAAGELSVDEQVTLLEILQRRIAESNREELVRDVEAARAEFATGRARSVPVIDIMEEARGDA